MGLLSNTVVCIAVGMEHPSEGIKAFLHVNEYKLTMENLQLIFHSIPSLPTHVVLCVYFKYIYPLI